MEAWEVVNQPALAKVLDMVSGWSDRSFKIKGVEYGSTWLKWWERAEWNSQNWISSRHL